MAKRTKTLKPFADDETSAQVAGLSIENGPDRVSISGSVDLTRDKAGLDKAKALQSHVDAIVAALEDDKELPSKVQEEPKAETMTVKNPFG